MRTTLLVVGETSSPELHCLIEEYRQRIGGYIPFDLEVLPDPKRRKQQASIANQQQATCEAIASVIAPSDLVVLLDERGKEYTSRQWAEQLQRYMNSGAKRLLLVVGGPYGFTPEFKQRYGQQAWSLSRLTLTHEMVRLFAVEQIYRACTILRGEPYHHD